MAKAKSKSKKKTIAALNKNDVHVNKFMQEVEREFQGLELVEAEDDLKLLVRASDVAEAYALQKEHAFHDARRFSTCMVAVGTAHQLGSNRIAIYKSRAIIEHAGDDGVTRAYRYIIQGPTKAAIAAFDRETLPEKDIMVKLYAPLPHQTLEGQRQYDVRKRAERAAGTYTPNPAASARARKAHTAPKAVLDVRTGQGDLQRTIKPKAA